MLCHILAFQNFLVTKNWTYNLGKSDTVTLESEPEASEKRNGIYRVRSGKGDSGDSSYSQLAEIAGAVNNSSASIRGIGATGTDLGSY